MQKTNKTTETMIQLTETRTENNNTITEVKTISQEQYNNLTNKDTLKFFRRLGGTETARKNYTKKGYVITKLISTSPDKSVKVIREFKFL